MGKEFIAVMPDGTERFAATLSMRRASMFYEITKIVEKHVGIESGLDDDDGQDEHQIDPEKFILFFEKAHGHGWITDTGSMIYHWAGYAAGMIENFTLTKKRWICRDGSELKVHRYLRPDEIHQEKPNK